MKTLSLALAALVVVTVSPASAASCCGKNGMCTKTGMSMSTKKGCCCQGMGGNMSKRPHQH